MRIRLLPSMLLGFLLVGAPRAPAESADQPTFAEMLAKAEAQAAAGHRWTPPGNNMTETVAEMMDIISTATPQQLAALSALLEKDGSHAPAALAPNRVAPPPAPPAPPYPSTPPSSPRPSSPPNARSVELLSRGMDAQRLGDVSGARRFYASAAAQGNATAALALGRLYDPTYLKQAALGGIDPDPALARHWYERAAALGDAEAGPLLEALSVR